MIWRSRWVINRFLKRWLDHCYAERRRWLNLIAEREQAGGDVPQAERMRDQWDQNITSTQMCIDYLWGWETTPS